MENSSLTSRIVGAIVLLSLAIIFVPVLLETDNIDSGGMNKSPIPDVPSEISTIVFQLNEDTGKFEEKGVLVVEQFEQDVIREIANSANEVEIPEVELVTPPVLVKPIQEKTGNTARHSWVLQLASFRDQDKALKLRDELRKKNYVTHISARTLDSGSRIWRVRIGPDINKSKIQKIQVHLEAEMGLKGLIIRRR